jgi:Ser/Thr protein kinase RdoA (MazF antagonist)
VANPSTVARIAAAYGLSPTAIAAAARGYRNHTYKLTLADGSVRNLIQYKRDSDILARIKRANATGGHAATQGLPARTPADPRITRATSGTGLYYFSLYNYLPGSTIPWEAYTRRHLKLLGLTAAHLHTALAGMPTGPTANHRATTELAELLERMRAYFAHLPVQAALGDKLHLSLNPAWLAGQAGLIAHAAGLPGQQPLHLDLVRSNILFAPARPTDPLQEDGLAVTGILDFEKAAWGHPHLDLARTLAFLLVDCRYKTPAEVRRYFLRSGYVKRGGSHLPRLIRPGAAKPLLDELVDLYLFYDFYKFLRHNPYESLPFNHHFRRTVALLRARQIVPPSGTISFKQTVE